MDTTPSHENSMNHLQQLDDPKNKPFTLNDLQVLVDYFYLPHIHGEKGQFILEEFCWLKHNAPGSKALKKRSLADVDCESNDSSSSCKRLEQKSDGDSSSSDDSMANGIDLPLDNDQVL